MKPKTPHLLARPGIVIAIFSVAIFIIAATRVKWSAKSGFEGSNTVPSGTVATNESPGASRKALTGNATKNSSAPAAAAPAAFVDPYAAYLDTICRRLTPAQEDQILAESNRDPRVLVGLALQGSPRAKQWLDEALRTGSHDPLVHYAVLIMHPAGFDLLKSAIELAKLVPDDVEALYAVAAEAAKIGDRGSAIAYLREASRRDEHQTSLDQLGLEARVNVFRLAGYPEQDAWTRILLENNSTLAEVAFADLNYLRAIGPKHVIAPGNEELAALLLAGAQTALYSSGGSLNSYRAARETEISYLKAFLRSSVESANPTLTNRYFETPVSEMHAAAVKDLRDFMPLSFFSEDKPGIFQRLTKLQQIELIGRIRKEGEVAAFRWAYQVRPDIFWSPTFLPRSTTQIGWKEYIKRRPIE